jgi:hypothetical protein
MRTAWLRWRQLAVGERFTLLKALFLLPLAGLLLRLFRYQSVFSALQRIIPVKKREAGAEFMAEALRTAELVNIAAWRGLYDATCLRRSLVLWLMLRRRGIDSSLRVGVRMEEGVFAAHAWVEWQDTVLNDAADIGERFATLL